MARISSGAKRALKDLEEAERKWAEAEEQASEAARKQKTATDRAIELTHRRNALAEREPYLTLHTGEADPEVSDNPLPEIDAELAEIDLEDLAARTEHARKLAASEKARVDSLIFTFYPEIEEALAPQAEACRERTLEKLNEASEALTEFLGWHQRFVSLAAQAPGLDGRAVRGSEHISAYMKTLRDPALPSPIPVKPEGWAPKRRSDG